MLLLLLLYVLSLGYLFDLVYQSLQSQKELGFLPEFISHYWPCCSGLHELPRYSYPHFLRLAEPSYSNLQSNIPLSYGGLSWCEVTSIACINLVTLHP